MHLDVDRCDSIKNKKQSHASSIVDLSKISEKPTTAAIARGSHLNPDLKDIYFSARHESYNIIEVYALNPALPTWLHFFKLWENKLTLISFGNTNSYRFSCFF